MNQRIVPVSGNNSLDSMKSGMRDFLSQLSSQDLHSLLKTTTGSLIVAESDSDAINSILLYSDAISLLNRKRIKREMLVKYLHEKKVKFTIQNATKSYLCNLVLEHWGCISINDQQYIFQDETESNYNKSSQGSTNNNFGQNQSTQDVEMLNYHQQQLIEGQRLGMEFSQWFYTSLNSQTDFGPQHFWQDCSLQIEFIQDEGKNVTCKNVQSNGTESCHSLQYLVNIEKIMFNPNLMNGLGVRGKINPHGLAQVLVCGTIHRGHVAIGIFEQVFGLLKDPSSGNFKVKFSVIRLHAKSTLAINGQEYIPQIQDSSLAGIIEEVDE